VDYVEEKRYTEVSEDTNGQFIEEIEEIYCANGKYLRHHHFFLIL